MQVKWETWTSANKIIFVSGCTAAVSFLLPWVDIGFMSRNGITQGTVLFGVLLLYPFIQVLKGRDIIYWAALGGIISAAILDIVYINSKTIEFKFMGMGVDDPINASSSGSHLFLIACAAMAWGVVMHISAHKTDTGNSITTANVIYDHVKKYRPIYRISFITWAWISSFFAIILTFELCSRLLYHSNEQGITTDRHYGLPILITILIIAGLKLLHKSYYSLKATSSPHLAKEKMFRMALWASVIAITAYLGVYIYDSFFWKT
ncbi:hypothetical protein [Zhongshania sp.]|jgi:hypothetical protein|uniref:hypothetical protein n=1 Tax=Zhongshania sp. TaxID=1971902 RepID=UPI0039E49611